MLRSVVLDGAYPLNGPDYAWYPSYAPAMRDKFDHRLPALARLRRGFPEAPSITSVRCSRELRLQPFSGQATDGDGKERRLHGGSRASRHGHVRQHPGPGRRYGSSMRRRAPISTAIRAPLLRLMAETVGSVDSEDARNSAADIRQWSAGLEVEVMCHDPPQIFDMRLPPALRAADRDRALAERRRSYPDTYAPFTLDEYRGMPLDYSFIDQCVAWPVAPADHPAGRPTPPNAVYPDVPALVISGELDNLTTPADGAAAAAAFPHGKQILIANSFHVNALPHARSGCAAGIVRHFIATLDPGDTGCASEVPAVRLVPRFVRHADEVEPAVADGGNAASRGRLAARERSGPNGRGYRRARCGQFLRSWGGPARRSFQNRPRRRLAPHHARRGALDGGSRGLRYDRGDAGHGRHGAGEGHDRRTGPGRRSDRPRVAGPQTRRHRSNRGNDRRPARERTHGGALTARSNLQVITIACR